MLFVGEGFRSFLKEEAPEFLLLYDGLKRQSVNYETLEEFLKAGRAERTGSYFSGQEGGVLRRNHPDDPGGNRSDQGHVGICAALGIVGTRLF